MENRSSYRRFVNSLVLDLDVLDDEKSPNQNEFNELHMYSLQLTASPDCGPRN
jgi:hypothetical protein